MVDVGVEQADGQSGQQQGAGWGRLRRPGGGEQGVAGAGGADQRPATIGGEENHAKPGERADKPRIVGDDAAKAGDTGDDQGGVNQAAHGGNQGGAVAGEALAQDEGVLGADGDYQAAAEAGAMDRGSGGGGGIRHQRGRSM